MITNNKQAISVLSMSTLAFSACFAIWVIFSIIGIPIKELLGLTETQFGLLIAMPILSGSLLRLPVGILTDRYGGRNVFMVLLLATIIPLYLIGSATEYWQFLVLGLFVGVAGSSFSVGVAYTAKWFPPANRGLAMGIFGAGNAGAALTNLIAPTLVIMWGWQAVPKVYAVAMTVVAIAFWMFTYDNPKHRSANNATLREQLALLKNPRIWKYCQYYSLVFGGFVGMSLWITKYYVNEFQLDLTTAALLASIFVLPSGIVRALGGWLSDRYGAYKVTWGVLWVSWICLFLLAYPQTLMTVKVINGEDWNLDVGLSMWAFTGLLFVVGISWGLGKASVFKGLADEFPDNLGLASGIVGLAGGMGGFLLPIMFGVLIDITRINSSVFMLLFGATSVSLVLMYFTFGRAHQEEVIQQAHEKREGDILLTSMAEVVAEQREALEEDIRLSLRPFAQQLSPVLNDQSALEGRLDQIKSTLKNFKAIYILNSKGIQITANHTQQGLDEDQLGRDRSQRPYLAGMFDGREFKLSQSYISKNKRQPSVTAIHAIRGEYDGLMGFVGVDYDLSKLPRHSEAALNTINSKAAKEMISLPMDSQHDAVTQMDMQSDDVMALIAELILEHGVFHAKLHFNSNRATIWHMDAPYNYHFLDMQQLSSADTCLAYPQHVYENSATIPSEVVKPLLEKITLLRKESSLTRLQSASLNICNGMIGLNFSAGGAHYLSYDEFLKKDYADWFAGN